MNQKENGGALLLIRHGQTHANLDQVWHGVTDTPLTNEGKKQAVCVGEHIRKTYAPVAAVYASQLQRAVQTARAISAEQGPTVLSDTRLKEMDAGEWEEAGFDFLQNDHNFFRRISADSTYSAPGGESRGQVQERMMSVLTEIAERHRNETVAVVSHGIAISVALAHLEYGDSGQWHRYNPNNTGISILQIPDLSLLEFNLTAHLS